jgi:hypothetical protein
LTAILRPTTPGGICLGFWPPRIQRVEAGRYDLAMAKV